jgi:co-chaperonin GroES (HSP10)
MIFKALKNKVIVRPIETGENKTAGGIHLPNTVEAESFLRGIVYSVGEDVKGIKVNDILAVHRNGGYDIMTNNQEIFKVLKEDEIFCKLTNIEDSTIYLDEN